MNQPRRDFFRSIAGLFTVAATTPFELMGREQVFTGLSAADTPLPIATQMEMLTRLLHSKIEKRLTWPTEVIDGVKLGSYGLTSQYGVDLAMDPELMWRLPAGDIETRFINPTAACLADELVVRHATKFGRLVTGGLGIDGSAAVETDRLYLRGLRAFVLDDGTGREPYWCTRFDVLFSWDITYCSDPDCYIITPTGEKIKSAHLHSEPVRR